MSNVDESNNKFDGYELLDTEVESFSLNNVGDHIQGVYDGIDERKIRDGVAQYMVVKVEGEGLKGIPINPSLERAMKKIKTGQHIIVELSELVESKGKGQPFKRYRVYVWKQGSGTQDELPL